MNDTEAAQALARRLAGGDEPRVVMLSLIEFPSTPVDGCIYGPENVGDSAIWLDGGVVVSVAAGAGGALDAQVRSVGSWSPMFSVRYEWAELGDGVVRQGGLRSSWSFDPAGQSSIEIAGTIEIPEDPRNESRLDDGEQLARLIARKTIEREPS